MKKTIMFAVLSILLTIPAFSSGLQEAIDSNFDSKVRSARSALGLTMEIAEMDGKTVLTIPEQLA